MSALPNIVVCNGADCSALSPSETLYPLLVLDYRETSERSANVRLGLPSFVSDLYHLPERLLDLLEIAAYVYCADRMVKRGDKDSLEYHAWSRSFHFLVRVRDFAFWSKDAVRTKLNELLTFLSGNQTMEFTFQPGHVTPPSNLFDQPGFEFPTHGSAAVALFSGGIDSLAGALTLLTAGSDHLYLVSHRSGQPSVRLTQERLVHALAQRYRGRISHYSFESGLRNHRAEEETQRTRFFLYASIAYTLAHRLGERTIQVFENGITSINLPRRQDLMLARSSRTTHPKTIAFTRDLFTLIEQAPVEIKTPFFEKTKCDVLSLLREANGVDLLSSSVSCSKTFKMTGGGTHCGGCSQCIDRRFASFASGLDDVDDAGLYGFNFLTQRISDGEVRTTLMDYVRQARAFAASSIDWFYAEEAANLVDIVEYVSGVDEAHAIEQVWSLYKRHGNQVLSALREMSRLLANKHVEAPEGSLLRLAEIPAGSKEQDYRPDTQETEIKVADNVRHPSQPMSANERAHGVAVVLTALGLECEAVLAHLVNRQESVHTDGTVYEVGEFQTHSGCWKVAVAEIGEGNEGAGVEAQRALQFFKPRVLLFVGVAGGLKDVKLGDVVAATEVFNYESGKDRIDFSPRPRSRPGAYGLVQRARAERRNRRWLQRISGDGAASVPTVYVGPIAAGWKVVASNRASTYKTLRKSYSHCLAVEMEGYGFLEAANQCRDVEVLVVRGISDLVEGKEQADASGSQLLAARNASAFAFEVLARLDQEVGNGAEPREPG